MTRTMRLGDAIQVDYADEAVAGDSSYPLAGVYGFGRGVFTKDTIRGVETKYKTLRRLKVGQLIFSRLKAFEGAVAIVPEEADGCYVSHEFPTFSLNPVMDRQYAAQLVQWDGFVERMRAKSTGIGARRERLHPDDFCSIVVPLPELDEQRRIAAQLDALSQVSLSLDNALMDRLGLLLDSIFDQFSWDTELSQLLELDVNEFEVDPGALYSQAGVFGGGRGMFLRGDLRGAETKYSRLRRVSAGQVVLSRLKAFEGAVAVVPDGLHGSVLSQEFPTFSVRDGVDPGFVSGLLGRHRFTEAMQSRSTGVGARRERLSVDGFLKIRVPLPTQDVQDKAGDVVRNRQKLDAALSRRTRLKDALLPAARNEIFSAMV